jgi:hypothetical protein
MKKTQEGVNTMITTDMSEISETQKYPDHVSVLGTSNEPETGEPESNEPQSDKPESNALEVENTPVQDASEEKAPAKNYDYSSFADITLSVLNDNGRSIDDVGLEDEVISLTNELRDKEITDLEKPAVALSKLRSLYKRYDEKTFRTEKINTGISTRHGILKGMILNTEKKLLRKKGKQWVIHYKETYGGKSLRAAQHWMALAKVPTILEYSSIGKERLTQVLRAVNTLKIIGDKPIAKFFEKYEVQLNPNSEFDETMTDIKLKVDYAVAVAKIKNYEEKMEVNLGVDLELIKRIINEGYSISSQFIKNLFEIKNVNHDVNAHIEIICNGSGNGDDMLPHIKKAESFSKIVEGLKNTVESIRTHRTLADRIKPDNVRELENYVAELKSLIENTDSTTE